MQVRDAVSGRDLENHRGKTLSAIIFCLPGPESAQFGSICSLSSRSTQFYFLPCVVKANGHQNKLQT